MFALLLALSCNTEAPEATTAAEAPAAEAPAAEETRYGEPFTLTETISAADLLGDPSKYDGQMLLVEGRITEVCQKAGCWMVIAEGDKNMRILMKDHSFAVPKDSGGSDCQIQGKITSRELDAEWVEHLASESERPDEMPEKNAVNNRVYEVEATGVLIRRTEG